VHLQINGAAYGTDGYFRFNPALDELPNGQLDSQLEELSAITG